MKIVIFIKEVPDTKIPIIYNELAQKVKEDWNVYMLNPYDRAAVEKAIEIKKKIPETKITIVHLGQSSGERWIRECFAYGCDEGVRIWDEDLSDIKTYGKAFIFARMAKILEFDLILTGVKSQDTGNNQIGTLLAFHLNVPCINSAISIDIGIEKRVQVTKRLVQGYSERIEASIPLVVTISEIDSKGRQYNFYSKLFETVEKKITCYELSDLGLSKSMILNKDSYLSYGPLRFPKPRLKYIAPPDSSLPAHLRIKKLIEGKIKSREGKINIGSEDYLVEQLFQVLLKEGWLDHLHKNKKSLEL